MPHDFTGPIGLRQMNRLRIIEALYHQPKMSRPELARRTGLSTRTVSALVDELKQAGLVAELEYQDLPDLRPRVTGRPPVLLTLVEDAGFAVGLDFGHQHIRVAICNLTGAAVVEDWSRADIDYGPTASFDLAADLVQSAFRRSGVPRDRLLGIGMGLAAPINSSTAELYPSGILPGWMGVRPAAEMEARLGVPVQLENDANLGALGEKVFGAGRDVDDLIYVRHSSGVGAGLILNGRPYRGSAGAAGEIGHVRAAENGIICRCGNRGCLETVASVVAVAALLERSMGQSVSVQRMLELVAADDRGAKRAVADAGTAVGRALATFVNALNPKLVIVGGELVAAGPVLLDPLRAAIESEANSTSASTVQVIAGELGDRAEVLGAAAMILSQSPPELAKRMSAGHRMSDRMPAVSAKAG